MDIDNTELLKALKKEQPKEPTDAEKIEAANELHDLPRPRRIQVEEVYQFLLEHMDDDSRTYTVYCACKQTFCRVKNGYPDMDALKAYCYSIDILDYVGR